MPWRSRRTCRPAVEPPGERHVLTLLPLLLVPLLATWIAGIVIVWKASAGRWTDRRCSCGYDMRQLPRDSTRCPECGRPRRHVTVRSPRLLTVGLVLVIGPFFLGIVLIGFVIWLRLWW